MFFNSTPSVSVREVAQQVTGENVVFIDVRTPGEYAGGHAKGAVNIPLDSLGDDEIAKFAQYKDVYVICQSGGRSSAATKSLVAGGVHAINVEGGTSAWLSQGLPME